MDLLEQFKSFLFSQNNKPSKVTVKNYISDVSHFIRWVELSSGKKFNPTEVTKKTLDNYKFSNSTVFSPSSIERHLSSLRKFFSFLKTEAKISSDPFKTLINSESEPKDLLRIKDFKNFLYVQNASHLTIKNYLIDIKQFLTWAEEVVATKEAVDLNDANILNHINSNLIEEYKNRLLDQGVFSPSTINRKLSSLRKYFSWLDSEKLIRPFSFEASNIQKEKNPELNIPVKNNEFVPNITDSQVKIYSVFPPLRMIQKISESIVLLLDSLFINHLANAAEAGQHLLWLVKGNPIFSKANKIRILKPITLEHIVGVKNLPKELYAPLNISTQNFPWYKKLWHNLKYKRPKWYATYHSYAIVHYFHFAVLLIFIVGLAVGLYNGFGRNQSPTLAANLPTAPNRVLSFQGRLTDSSDNPITAPTNLRFSIYRDGTATGAGILLWQEVDQVSPDTDGIFNSILGNSSTVCADPTSPATGICSIPSTLFSQNNALFLGVTVERTSELTPRQPIATVAFASNSETLQGLLPITATAAGTTNVILALDSSGNLTIGGSAAPVFQASGGQFTLSGQPLLLTTNAGSNSNVTIAPNGLGIIDLQKVLQNTTNNNNISSALGAVEVDDLFAILATSSGQSALTVNQNGLGPIFSASASGLSKFTIKANGELIANAYGTCTLKTDSTGLVACGVDNSGTSGFESPFRELSGAIVPLNSTLDFFIGGQSTASAEFAISNVNGTRGTQTASLSGNLILDSAAASIGATKNQLLTIGGNTTGSIMFKPGNSSTSLYLSANGNVAIGTNAVPSSTLVVSSPNFSSTTVADFQVNGTSKFTINSTNGLTLFAGGNANGFVPTALVLGLSGGVNITSETVPVQINAPTYTITGSYPTQRITRFSQPTITAASPLSISTEADTVNIAGAPISAGSAGIANSIALRISSGTSIASGVTNGYGLYVDAPTGAANNYSAVFPTGNVGVGTASPLVALDARGYSGTLGVASISGSTSFAAFAIDNSGVGDLFTASKSGQSRFTIKGNGQLIANAYQTCTLKTDANGLFTCGADLTGTAGFESPFTHLSGAIVALNSTEDFLLGSQATSTARFRITANNQGAGTTAVASISGRTSFAALVVNNDGNGDIISASVSGAPRFAIDSNGDLRTYGTNPFISANGSNTLTLNNNSTGNIIANNDLQVNGNDILDSTSTTRIALGATTTFTNNTTAFTNTSAFTANSLNQFTTSTSLSINPNTGNNMVIDTSASTLLTLFGTPSQITFGGNASTFNIGPAAGATATINIAGGSGATGCTIDGATGNLACSGLISSLSPTGVQGWWNVANGTIFPTNSTLDLLIGGQSTASADFAFINVGAGDPTASIGGNLAIVVPTGNAKTTEVRYLNNSDLLFRNSVGGDAGLHTTFAILNNNAVAINGVIARAELDITGSATLSGNLIFKGSGTSTINKLDGGDIRFNTSVGGDAGLTAALTIKNNRNIGIGTTTPTAKLDVNGSVSVGGQLTFQDTFGTIQTTADQSLNLGGNTTGQVILKGFNGALNAITFSGYNTCTLKTDSAGVVNCGTDNTGAGGSSSPFSELSGAIVANNTTEDFILGSQASVSARFRVSANTLGAGTRFVASVSGKTSFAGLVANNDGVGDLFTASSSGWSRFVIQSNGNVGIGTSNPQHALELGESSARAGGIGFGDDALLWRTGAGALLFDGNGTAIPTQFNIQGGATSVESNYGIAGDTFNRIRLSASSGFSGFQFGPGDANQDVQIYRGGSSRLYFDDNGTLNPSGLVLGINNNFASPSISSTFDIRGANGWGTLSIASVSGRTSFAALVANNEGVGDIFSASKSGQARFTIKGNGQLIANAYQTCTLKTDATGLFTCGTDLTGGGGSSPFTENTALGTIFENNNTEDFLLGGLTTSSAEFSFTGLSRADHQTIASFSGNLVVMPNNGFGGYLSVGTPSSDTRFRVAGTTANDIAKLDIGLDINPVLNPLSGPSIAAGAAGNVDVGQHFYYITYVTALGETSPSQAPSSPTSVTIVTSAKQVNLTNIPISPDYRVISKKVYRTPAASGANYWVNVKLVASIPNTQTSYTDNTADSGLTGSGVYYNENTTAEYFTLNNQGIFLPTITNTLIGYQTGQSIYAGTAQSGSNTLVGSQVAPLLTTGANNTALGSRALFNDTTGDSNTAIGYSALQAVNSGSFNVAVGRNAGVENQTGSGNTLVGYVAGFGQSAQSFDYNSFFGNQSGAQVSTGSYNTFLGANSGYNLSSGASNIVLGAYVDLPNLSGNQQLNIGNVIFGTGIYNGSSQVMSSAPALGKIGINASSPLSTLDVRYASGTISIASFSGRTSFASLIANNDLVAGDLFSASSSSQSRFTIKGNGQLIANAYQTCTLKTDATGLFTCGTDLTGSSSGYSPFQELSGAIVANNTTMDFLLGSQASVSARFRVSANTLGAGTRFVASVSGKTSFATLVANNDGVGDLFTASASGWNRFVIQNNGNVGIGTSNPQHALELGASTERPGGIGFGTDTLLWRTGPGALLFDGNGTGISTRFDFQAGAGTVSSEYSISGDNTTRIRLAASSGYSGLLFGAGGAATNHDVQIYRGGTSKLYMDDNGALTPSSLVFGFNNNYAAPDIASTFDIRGANGRGTQSIASVSGRTSFAALVANNDGRGDLFTASASGTTRFRIAQNGSILMQGTTIASIGTIGAGAPSLTNDYAVINAQGDQGSMVPNGGFESIQAAATFADGWVLSATTTATVTRDTAAPANGNASLLVTSGAGQVADIYSACIPITGGQTYSLSFFQKGNVLDGLKVRAYLRQYTSQGNCQNNTSGTNTVSSSTTTLPVAYAGAGATNVVAITSTTWARVNLLIGGPTAARTANIDSVRLVPNAVNNGTDYAEYYPADPNNMAEPGDIVSVQSATAIAQVKPTDKKADNSVIGIVSTEPGITLGSEVPEPRVAVALSGRVPTKVSLANGSIHIGDMLQSSDVPGVAVKALQAGPTVAVADENFDSESTIDTYYALSNGKWAKVFTCDIHSPNCVGVGKIIANIKMSYYDPQPLIASIESLRLIDGNPSDDFSIPHYFTLNDALGNPITKVGAFLELAVGNLRAGAINAQQITTKALSVASENISINGIGIRAYISSIVSDAIDNLNGTYLSPIASVDQIHTDLISPLNNSSDIALDLSNSKLTIRNGKTASSSAVASIDNQGNATLSGSLAVGKDASIAGTLRAGKIIADEIVGLNIKSATIAANYITNNNITNVYNSTASSFPTLSAAPASSYSGSSVFGNLFASNSSYINIATYSSQLAYVENFAASNAEITNGLMVFGTSSLSDTSITGQLSVNGSLILGNNSINALGSDLSLQPLRQGGLSIMAGLIYVDTNGNIKIKGDATINGTLYANLLSPIPGNDLSIKLPDDNSNSSVKIKGASGSAVLSINGFGDLIASGEATFGKLNISNLVGQALAVSPTEVIATGSAGTGVINPHQTLMTIDNKLVTAKSLIYITPTSNTNNQVLFLLRQVPGKSFTVGLQNMSTLPIPFNWIIIN